MKIDDIEILSLIGNTPLYKLKTDTGGADVWIKLEGSNPGGSIKDRAVWGMLKKAELKGDLKNDTVRGPSLPQPCRRRPAKNDRTAASGQAQYRMMLRPMKRGASQKGRRASRLLMPR